MGLLLSNRIVPFSCWCWRRHSKGIHFCGKTRVLERIKIYIDIHGEMMRLPRRELVRRLPRGFPGTVQAFFACADYLQQIINSLLSNARLAFSVEDHSVMDSDSAKGRLVLRTCFR
jgi:hypothetical protein